MPEEQQDTNANPTGSELATPIQTDQPAQGAVIPVGQSTAATAPKKIPPGFLKDADGNPSSMRLMNVIALFASIWFGWMTLNSNASSQNGVYITTAFLIGAFAPKALQKFIENYYPKDKRPTGT